MLTTKQKKEAGQAIKDSVEIGACRLIIKAFKEGYGANCKTCDLDDGMHGKKITCEIIMSSQRCGSCRAKETIKFLKDHISLLKEDWYLSE